MVLVDITPRRATPSSSAHLVRAIAEWLAAFRAKRKRRTTLRSLLFAPDHRLRDLGITREDLVQALNKHRGQTRR